MLKISKTTESSLLYWIAIFVGFVLISSRYLIPDIIGNESFYEVGPLRVINPSFLETNPFIKQIESVFPIYNYLSSIFHYFFSVLYGTICNRIVIWIFQLWALSRLLRKLSVPWWGFILVIFLLLNFGQSIAAKEWMIGSASSKPMAYGFVFLALESLLREHLNKSAIYSGISILFHPLVGFWSFAAICVAMMMGFVFGEKIFLMKIIKYILITLIISMPIVIFNAGQIFPGGINNTDLNYEVAKISVLTGNPLHLNPSYFLNRPLILKLIIYFSLTLITIGVIESYSGSRKILFYLFVLMGFFISGIIANHFKLYGFLKLFPFRVADSIIPLFLYTGITIYLEKIRKSTPTRKFIIFIIILFVCSGLIRYSFELANHGWEDNDNVLGIKGAILWNEPRITGSAAKQRLLEWTLYLKGTNNDSKQLENWVIKNTKKNSIFITPPWGYDGFSFSLKTGREEFWSFKFFNADSSVIEWKKRIDLLNRGPVRSVGLEIVREAKDNYLKMTEDEIQNIKKNYKVDYFITSSIIRLKLKEAYRNKSFIIYKI